MNSTLIYNPATGLRHTFVTENLIPDIKHACRAVDLPDGVIHNAIALVSNALDNWLAGKSEVTNSDIRRHAAEHLSIISPEAGYLYENQHAIM